MGSFKPIKTYTTEDFRLKFMQEGPELDQMLKSGFGRFFICRVEEMLRIIKLPVPPNRATTHIIIFLVDGTATINVGSQTYHFGKNECIVIPAGQIISFSELDQNKGYICNLHADFLLSSHSSPEMLREFEFFTVWGNRITRLGDDSGCYGSVLMERMLREYESNGLNNASLIQANLVALIHEIDQHYESSGRELDETQSKITKEFKRLIFERIRELHSVSGYAELLNVSPNYLNKLIKSATGQSPISWINELLIMEAKVLLYQTPLSINEVATELGVSDPSYFSRFFKKHTGQSPASYRKAVKMS